MSVLDDKRVKLAGLIRGVEAYCWPSNRRGRLQG